MEATDVIEYDDDGGHNGQSRKRKEPDSGRDEDSNSLNLANAQWVNQWIQVRSSPANDFRRPIWIWTRFSTTITTLLPYNNFVLSLLDISRLPFQRGRLNLKYSLFSLID